jgi:hypothetical protein
VTVAERPVSLTPTEYKLLYELVTNAGRVVVPHADLLRKAWGQRYDDATEYVRVYVRYLRQKLEPDPSRPRYIPDRARRRLSVRRPRDGAACGLAANGGARNSADGRPVDIHSRSSPRRTGAHGLAQAHLRYPTTEAHRAQPSTRRGRQGPGPSPRLWRRISR